MTQDSSVPGEPYPGDRVASHPAPLERIPKADLHCHLDGSLRPGTVAELARELGHPLGDAPDDAVRAALTVDTEAPSLLRYLAVFETTLLVLQTPAAVRRAARELVEDAAAEAVWLLEVRFCPYLHTRGGAGADAIVDAALEGLAEGGAATGTAAGLVLCAIRDRDLDEAGAVVDLAARRAVDGVVGVDLAGPEAGFPAARFGGVFSRASDAGLGVTIHAGEADGAGSVWAALEDCRAARVGHGCRSIEDPALVEALTERRVTVEACPTSNRQTGAVAELRSHPMARLLEAGVPVSVATDNRLVSHTRVSDELERARRALGWDADAVGAVVRAGFGGSFLPDAAGMLTRAEPCIRASLEELRGSESSP